MIDISAVSTASIPPSMPVKQTDVQKNVSSPDPQKVEYFNSLLFNGANDSTANSNPVLNWLYQRGKDVNALIVSDVGSSNSANLPDDLLNLQEKKRQLLQLNLAATVVNLTAQSFKLLTTQMA